MFKHKKTNLHNRIGSSSSTCTSPSNTTNTTNKTGKMITCHTCKDSFATYKELFNLRMIMHKQTSSGKLQSDPWTEEITPRVNEDDSGNESMKRVYDQHRHLILRESVRR